MRAMGGGRGARVESDFVDVGSPTCLFCLGFQRYVDGNRVM